MAIDMKRLKFGSKVKIIADPNMGKVRVGDIVLIARSDFFHRESKTIFDSDGFLWVVKPNNPTHFICVFHGEMNPAELHNYIKVLKY